MSNVIEQQKKLLRRSTLAERGNLTEQDRLALSKAAVRRLLEVDEVEQARSVLTFSSFGHEISTDSLIDDLLERGKKVLIPWVDGQSLAAAEIRSRSELQPGFRGIHEPSERTAVAPTADVIIVPGVAFDELGRRLGYGGAFFDQFLKTTRGFRIGLCFDLQIANEIPVEDHDEPVDMVVTDSRTLRLQADRMPLRDADL
jgi:5-formyltetrahydrofolate cyclo-ligase